MEIIHPVVHSRAVIFIDILLNFPIVFSYFSLMSCLMSFTDGEQAQILWKRVSVISLCYTAPVLAANVHFVRRSPVIYIFSCYKCLHPLLPSCLSCVSWVSSCPHLVCFYQVAASVTTAVNQLPFALFLKLTSATPGGCVLSCHRYGNNYKRRQHLSV